MQITVLSATIETATNKKGGTYQKLVLAFKDDKGKVQGKTIVDFVDKELFSILSAATSGEAFNITMVKEAGSDGKEYWQWKKAVATVAGSSPAKTTGNSVAASPAATKGTWETPEERAKKQVYIVRQSSISSAVDALTAGVKTPPKADEIIAYAKQLEAYVFDTDLPKEAPAVVDEFNDSIPF